MIEFIQSETKKMMFNCCEKYAKDNRLAVEDVQLILGLNLTKVVDGVEVRIEDESELNKYTICEKYEPKKDLTILEVLNVRIDFLGYSKLAPPFILKSLLRFSEQKEILPNKVCIMCVPYKNEKGKPEINLALYNGNKYVEIITFDDLFREEDFSIPS